ncbi:MFS transporter [Nocardia terpenica]|uniref:MFS transporter n=1 Tax=Nocardia terpenica TaxID=455432 RepID=A0A6G9ZC74_9NOCA|nr:MFS transporter [Nocardia terpenica]QIS23138.1 MFS transporter [Nocardia terpenica]
MPIAIPLSLLGLGSTITALDFTIVYIALPQISRDLGFSPYALQWVVTAYAVALGGFLLLGGRLSDLLGRRRMFVTGMLLYAGSSLLGGLATAPALLIAARAVQGIGGAVLMPATLALVVTMFEEGPARNRAMTVWAASGAAGLSLGALLGGVLTGGFGWSAVFFVNVPLGLAGALAALRILPADGARHPGRFDLPGAVTGTAGITCLVFTIAHSAERGLDLLGAVALVLAVALLAGFVATEARSRNPLLPLRLLTNRHTAAGVAAILGYGMTLQCVPYFLTLHFQTVLGYGAVRSGLAFLGPTLGITVGNLAGERLIPRLGLRGTMALSVTIGVLGTIVLALSLSATGSYLGLLGGLLGFGVGAGLTYSTMFIVAATGVAPQEQGAVSGLAATVLQAGNSAGLAILVAVSGHAGFPAHPVEGLRAAVFTAGIIAVAGALAALVLPRAARRPEPALN